MPTYVSDDDDAARLRHFALYYYYYRRINTYEPRYIFTAMPYSNTATRYGNLSFARALYMIHNTHNNSCAR